MKRITVFMLLTFLISYFGCECLAESVQNKDNGKTNMETVNKKIETLYNTMYKFMIDKNVLSLGKMLDDNFILVHMTGLKQNKQEYLNYIKNGTLNYFSNTTENIIIENNSKFIGQSKVSAAVFGGGKHTWNLELTIELTENNLIKKITASTY